MDSEQNLNNKDMGCEKTPGEKNNAEDISHASNEDLEEFENVSNEIDSINQFLDNLENNVDSIKDQLLSILTSNREILKELKEQKDQESNESSNDEESKPMET